MTSPPNYPWYDVVDGNELYQGDLLPSCPLAFAYMVPEREGDNPKIAWERRDVILLSQSCDLVVGREKLRDVLLCPTIDRTKNVDRFLATPKGLEDARRGNVPFCHLLAACELPGHETELRIVNFREVYSMPLAFIRRFAVATGPRLRLLPPYREHLAQSFARYFMRVGLPADIPPFR